MNFSQLALLSFLEECDFNLSRASQRLDVVQSAASRQLQLLEDELGVPILIRNGKKIHGFTPLGTRLMREVELIDLAKRNIERIADDFLDDCSGMLRIATTHTQAKYLLPTPITRFRVRYPGVRIYMIQSSPGEILDLLRQHKVDLAICTEKLANHDNLEVLPCYIWHHIAVVPQNHPLRDKDFTLRDLAAFPLLTYLPGYTGYSSIEKAFRTAGLELDISLSAADSEVIKTYVRLGMGIGLISSLAYEIYKLKFRSSFLPAWHRLIIDFQSLKP